MALKKHRKYMVKFNLPDGPHVAVHDDIVIEGREDAEAVTQRVMMFISQNPDAVLVDVEPLGSQKQLDEEVKRVKDAVPGRPTADELVESGQIDVTNRLMTNPEIPRGIAAMLTPG